MADSRYCKRADGLGVWVAFESMLPDKGRDLGAVCSELAELGVRWVAPRVGDYGKLALSEARIGEWVAACAAHGLGLLPWYYSRPQFFEREVGLAVKLLQLGATGVIVDAEVEWANKHGEAERYGRLMRDAVGDAYIAHAPMPAMHLHRDWPYEQFGQWIDQVHPQTYWTEVANGTYEWTATNCFGPLDALNAAGDLRANGYAPIGVTYGRQELARLGGPNCPGDFKVADLDAFLTRYDGAATLSLYSWELAGPEARDALRRRLARRADAPTIREGGPVHGTHIVDVSIEEYRRLPGRE